MLIQGAMMADQMYVERDHKNYGPFSTVELKQLAVTGKLLGTDLLWKEGMSGRVPAAGIKILFPVPITTPEEGAYGLQSVPSAGTGSPAPTEIVDVPAPAALPEGLELVPIAEDGARPPEPVVAALTPSAAPEVTIPSPLSPTPRKEEARKRRAVIASGGILVSQDGMYVRYRNKCTKCSFVDDVTSRMAIPTGMKRGNFFCPKCKKIREVQIQGTL